MDIFIILQNWLISEKGEGVINTIWAFDELTIFDLKKNCFSDKERKFMSYHEMKKTQ